MHNSVSVVVPLYQDKLNSNDQLSLNHLKKYLSCFQIIVVMPHNHKLPNDFYKLSNLKTETFKASYFKNSRSYSKLLLNTDFYEKFIEYDYILIYQLDALVFNHDLQYWVNKGYDYIGAPWENSIVSYLTHSQGIKNAVGNGGLSLRRVESHLDTLKLQQKIASNHDSHPIIQLTKALVTGKSRQLWLKSEASSYPFNEDGFWSLEASKINPDFKVAPREQALEFAWEKNCEKKYSNRKLLPFGCHAWNKYEKGFWLAILNN